MLIRKYSVLLWSEKRSDMGPNGIFAGLPFNSVRFFNVLNFTENGYFVCRGSISVVPTYKGFFILLKIVIFIEDGKFQFCLNIFIINADIQRFFLISNMVKYLEEIWLNI